LFFMSISLCLVFSIFIVSSIHGIIDCSIPFVFLMWGIFQTEKIKFRYLVLLVCGMIAGGMDLIPVFPIERSSIATGISWAVYLQQNMHIPFIISLVYYVVIFGIQEAMSGPDVKPFDLRIPLGIWSSLLAAFSFMGAVRTVPVLIQIIAKKGMFHMICGDSRMDWADDNAAVTWTLLFILSKIPELVDTLFIVLRKKPLM
jgi:hypothetical protein